MSVWLSIDPLSDERPSLSAYNYCQWNPVMLVDPTGMIDELIENLNNYESRPSFTQNSLNNSNAEVLVNEESNNPQLAGAGGEDPPVKKEPSTARQLFYSIPVLGPTQESSDLLAQGDYIGAIDAFGWAVLDLFLLGRAGSIRAGIKPLSFAKKTDSAFDIAKAGGKHAGFYRNYLGRNPDEINKAIKSLYEGKRGIIVHIDKIANPSKYVQNWNKLESGYQQRLIQGWKKEITNSTEQIEILKGILNQ